MEVEVQVVVEVEVQVEVVRPPLPSVAKASSGSTKAPFKYDRCRRKEMKVPLKCRSFVEGLKCPSKWPEVVPK